ncbi:hypothetical protein [Streptomyces erythrochromogenes]|uniref:hypothetical protein n=1 Tax=Streptomyces erythrochromogenes TaxID=285574 RepID=UPI0038638BC7|nr:hypothetical protein OG364_06900 [Streptomyces erythrochromogenes]
MAGTRSRPPFLGLLPLPERQAITRAPRTETVGGPLLLGAAVLDSTPDTDSGGAHADGKRI